MAPMETLGEILAARADATPDRLAFAFSRDGEHDTQQLTYLELHRHAQRIAAELLEAVPGGAHALLLFEPGLDFVSALFACLQAGVVAVSAMPAQPDRLHRALPRLQRVAEDAGVRAVLTTAAIIAAGGPALDAGGSGSPLAAARWIAVDGLEPDEGPGVLARDPDRIAFLQYTSGSTADPRGVILSHAHFLANSRLIAAGLRLSAESRGFCWLPATHDMGLISGILQPVILGFPSALMPPLAVLRRPLRWLAGISRFRATLSGAPNFAYELAVHRTTPEEHEALDLAGWDVAFCGAEPVRAATIDAFCDAFAPRGFRRDSFYPCYGLAEATLMVTGPRQRRDPTLLAVDGAALERGEARPADGDGRAKVLVGVGEPGAGHELAIVDEHTLTRRPPGEVGEIWVSGPSVAAGYWHADSEGEFHARIVGEEGARTYLRTGDLGFLHAGELFIVGRIKDVLIIRGRNVHPQDVELAAESAHAALRRTCSAAFTVETDAGEDAAALVIEVDGDADAKPADMIRQIRRRVAAELGVQLHRVALVGPGAVPKTTSGKVQRRLCRRRLLAGELEPLAESRLRTTA
jgi:acyl-CoA synthetase (AMP-forming)/AMP-acid ligase II